LKIARRSCHHYPCPPVDEGSAVAARANAQETADVVAAAAGAAAASSTVDEWPVSDPAPQSGDIARTEGQVAAAGAAQQATAIAATAALAAVVVARGLDVVVVVFVVGVVFLLFLLRVMFGVVVHAVLLVLGHD